MKTWFKSGSPWIWLHGGALAISVVMVVGLLILITVRGIGHFWPSRIMETTVTLKDGKPFRVLGEVINLETATAAAMKEAGFIVPEGKKIVRRHLIKLGNRDITGRDFKWFMESEMSKWRYPKDAIMLERREWGNFYGYPLQIKENDRVIAEGEALWPEFEERLKRSNKLFNEITYIEKHEIGDVNYRVEKIRLKERGLELDDSISPVERKSKQKEFAAQKKQLSEEYDSWLNKLDELRKRVKRDVLVAEVMDGQIKEIPLEKIVRVSRPNAMNLMGKMGYFLDKLWEFVSGVPREANTEGGIFPAIFGTVSMVLAMSVLVTPFGILAAIYLREYAKPGILSRLIRISVYNLAGVPSIVYGVFGLGFFVYFLGGNIDKLFFPERLPAPTLGTGGLFWASLTLALLTLPVVIVSTEEGLARIPGTIREGSLALGATKAETLWRVVIPLASPAMMTGLILAVARAAGEVAPLMLVGVVKLAPTLPIDGYFPFVHLENKIMHLGFHIYDVGFQSPNVEAARPLVYATALALVILIVALNLTAIFVRNHLREKFRREGD